MPIGSILLAAGGSTRLGSPKQLLRFRGESLLRRAAAVVLAAGCRPVVAVLGARAGEMRAELAGLDVAAVENARWERGMGSSLRLGLAALLGPGSLLSEETLSAVEGSPARGTPSVRDMAAPTPEGAFQAQPQPPLLPEGVLLTLCDQPLVGAAQLGALLAAFARGAAAGRPLAAAAYGGGVGVPAVFGRRYFEELLALEDAAGAKPTLLEHRAELIEVPMPEAATDIDTREQYARLAADLTGARGAIPR